MAFASSRIGAQEAIIKACDLCEEDENVNWFCKDCVQNLCERCKKTHLKIASCKNHRLVSILEGVAIRKTNVSNLCKEHDEPFLFFCHTCEENICSVCLSMVHKKHNFTDLRNLQTELQRKLDSILEKKEEEKMQMVKDINVLQECSKQCTESLKKHYATIDDRIKDLHMVIDEEGKLLKTFIKSVTDAQYKEVEEEQQKLDGKKDEYDETIQTVRQGLILQTASTINQFVKTSESKLKSLMPISLLVPSGGITLTVGKIDRDIIRDMVCNIDIQQDKQEPYNYVKDGELTILTKLQIINIYSLNSKKTYQSICLSPDGSIWFGGHGFVCNMNSDCSKVLCEIPIRSPNWNSNYIACLQSGDAVVSYGGNASYVDRFNSNGRRMDFIDLTPRDTRNIAVADDGHVAVSIGDGINTTEPHVGIFSTEGKCLREIKMSKNMGSFCINKDGDYATSDRVSPFLTTLDGSGTMLKKMRISKSDFLRMECDQFGNIIGVPRGESVNEIHIICENGNVKRSFTIECNDICDICIDSNDRLLILIDSGKVIVSKYLK